MTALALVVALALASWSTCANADPTDQDCLVCHAEQAGGGSMAGTSAHLDSTGVRGSVHGRLGCTGCHGKVASFPHATPMPAVRCTNCHAGQAAALARSAHARVAPGSTARRSKSPTERACVACHGSHDVRPAVTMGEQACASCHAGAVADYRGSVHGVALARGDEEASTCKSCHGGTHDILPHTDANAPTSHERLAETCAHCHADRELVTRRKITIPEAYALFRHSVHGRSGQPDAATCNDCHESHRLRRAMDPASSINRANIPATCGRCHASAAQAYRIGVHGTALARGVTSSPVCTDCHGEHLIRGPKDLDSPVASAQVTETCSRCHEAAGIRETYGLPAGRLSTYQDSYHGLAARGGSPAVANCASCHGEHDILPSNDPRSAIHAQNLPQTCGKCHPGAGPHFAAGGVHVAMATPAQPVLFWVRWIYLLLIAVTIGAMALHNGLDFVRRVRESLSVHLGRLAAPALAATTRWYERMTVSERLQHGLLAASFFTLVYTGFALKYPEAWPFAWFARLEGGYAWRSLIHRAAAIVMVAVAAAHVIYLLTRRGRETIAAMRPGVRDVRELGQNLMHLVGRRSRPPAFDRFSYVEKAEYWALIWGTVVMTVTGVVLWFENQSLRWLDKWMLDLATMIHYYEAWLAFLAVVVWHLYHVMLRPDVYPMNWTWLTGRISENQLEHEHAGEWQRLVKEKVAEASSKAESSAEDEPPAPRPGSVDESRPMPD